MAAVITQITQTANGNVRFLDEDNNTIYLVNRTKSVYLDINDSEIVRVGDVLTDGSFTPSGSIALNPVEIAEVGGDAFSGNAQDLIDLLDGYFFG
jgi:hypothetical protein